MIILAIEMSATQNDVALLRGNTVVARRTWNAREFHHTRLFELLPELFREAGVSAAQIELFAVGRGPGSFSGTRVALTAAQALAMPGGQPVIAVSSGEALAHEIAAAGDAEKIAVLGDARRDTIWLGVFDGKTGTPLIPPPWTLLPLAQLGTVLPAGTKIVSPDWHRLATLWPANLAAPNADSFPSAEFVARLALERHARGLPSDPLVPIYLHPAVATLSKK
ncbi:MAG: tRNA (adenosine(37)-N6)-threonylcarbamoyltransferase complex dimerization subunit type 1 TsaB [Verrucomicrobia bacterium]|nr:MAG: tRNA (adenosine(37)-N6)-threonylcarbamoyltransferase complex dimerization subunit type 1 TsaB [Verrucomicrobiota bacterium]